MCEDDRSLGMSKYAQSTALVLIVIDISTVDHIVIFITADLYAMKG